MSTAHPTAPAASVKAAKPGKPYPDFPLTAHPASYWCKKIRGKIHSFGPWADPDAALAKYLEQKDELDLPPRPLSPDRRPALPDLRRNLGVLLTDAVAGRRSTAFKQSLPP